MKENKKGIFPPFPLLFLSLSRVKEHVNVRIRRREELECGICPKQIPNHFIPTVSPLPSSCPPVKSLDFEIRFRGGNTFSPLSSPSSFPFPALLSLSLSLLHTTPIKLLLLPPLLLFALFNLPRVSPARRRTKREREEWCLEGGAGRQ